jgi:HEAT repeat protein
MPLFVSALKDTDLRAAALSGLGKLGDSSTVPVLAEAAATSQGAEQAAARSSLYALRGRSIDQAIISALESAGGRTKVELIMAAGERGISQSADVLIKAVGDKDPDVHREALRALRNVAGTTQVPALLQILTQSSTASDRREATQTVASVLKRSESARVDTVITAYKAASDMPTRLALLDIMGQTSNEQTLPLLRDSLKDPAPEIARGAILALSEWATPAPLPDLLAAARNDANPTLQVLALRGYLKLMALPSQRLAVESAKMLGEAMQLARQPAEKRTVLSLLSTFPCKESLQIAEAAVKDPQVMQEAKMAVERINGLLRFQ